MKAFEKFYEGEKGNNQSDLNVLNMTVHTFPKDYARIFWESALEWRLESEFCNVASRQEIEEELNGTSEVQSN